LWKSLDGGREKWGRGRVWRRDWREFSKRWEALAAIEQVKAKLRRWGRAGGESELGCEMVVREKKELGNRTFGTLSYVGWSRSARELGQEIKSAGHSTTKTKNRKRRSGFCGKSRCDAGTERYPGDGSTKIRIK
jgi:hypothetical protein